MSEIFESCYILIWGFFHLSPFASIETSIVNLTCIKIGGRVFISFTDLWASTLPGSRANFWDRKFVVFSKCGLVAKQSCLSNFNVWEDQVAAFINGKTDVDVVYPDLVKAFDNQNQGLLRTKLQGHGVHYRSQFRKQRFLECTYISPHKPFIFGRRTLRRTPGLCNLCISILHCALNSSLRLLTDNIRPPTPRNDTQRLHKLQDDFCTTESLPQPEKTCAPTNKCPILYIPFCVASKYEDSSIAQFSKGKYLDIIATDIPTPSALFKSAYSTKHILNYSWSEDHFGAVV